MTSQDLSPNSLYCLLHPMSETAVSVPATPLPGHSNLPPSHGADAGVVNKTQSARVEQAEVVANAVASLPASQTSQPSHARMRTPTPVSALLSSPPPTASRQMMPQTPTVSTSQIRNASTEELRFMVTDLLSAFRNAKTTAAHYKLQHQMLTLESAEAAERAAVEVEMAQREVDVLRTVEQKQALVQQVITPQPESDPNFRSVHVDIWHAMAQEVQDLKALNAKLDATIAQNKRVMHGQEAEITSLNNTVVLMRERIRESRDHVNKARVATGLLDSTPRADRTPYQTPRRAHVPVKAQEQQGFAALLHATDIMSQEAISTPSSQGLKRTYSKAGHSAGSQPSTPQRASARPAAGNFYTPRNSNPIPLKVPRTEPVARKLNFHTATAPPVRPQAYLGHESDGTVSATDDSEAETEIDEADAVVQHPVPIKRNEIPMLQTPTKSHVKPKLPGLSTVQGKLYGQVKKALQLDGGLGKGQTSEAGADVGLGIAGSQT